MIQGYGIIAYKFKRHLIAGNGIKGGRLTEHCTMCRGEEMRTMGKEIEKNQTGISELESTRSRTWGSSSQMVRVSFPGL